MPQREIESLGVAIQELLKTGNVDGAMAVACAMQGKLQNEKTTDKEAEKS